MSPNRREFLWSVGAAAGVFALFPVEEELSPSQGETGPGWSPGIEERITSACLVCPARCGISGRVVDGRLVRIMGNRLHPMSRGGLCPRAIAGPQLQYHPDRITSPMVRAGERGGDEWREVSWPEAIDQLTERLRALREAGQPEALAALVGYCTGSMDDVWRQFLEAVGSRNYVSDAYEDGTDAVVAAMHGVTRRPGYDLAHADTVLSFGAPLFESWWSPLQAYAAFARSEGQQDQHRLFVQIDHRFSRTAAHADAWVGVRPGTHAVLALGLAYVILRDRLYNESFVAEHVTGFEDFTDERGRRREGYRSIVMRHFRSEEVSTLTGVTVERITELARSFAGSARAVAICGPDVTLAPDGLVAGMAVHSLNVLVGSIGRPGGLLFGSDAPLEPLVSVAADPTSRAGLSHQPIGGPAPTFGNGDPAMRFASAVAAAPNPPVQVLLVHGSNPLGASRRPDVWAQALAKIPFVACFSPFLDETARHADIVLPDLLPFERWQDAPSPASYPCPVWSVSRPLVAPGEGRMHTGEVLFAVAGGFGGTVAESLPYERFEALLRDRARGLFRAHRGGTLASDFEMENQRLRGERGWWLPSQPDFDSFWSELLEHGGWADMFYDYSDPDRFARTRSGRIDLMPMAVLDALESEGGGTQLYTQDVRAESGSDPAFPLRLLPYRVSTLASDTVGLERWLAEQPSVYPDVQWVPWVSISPATANAAGLDADAMVWVVSARGRYRARLRLSSGTAPGTVCAPFGLRHPDGEAANPLQLLDDLGDPHTGMPSWFTTFVRLEQA